MALGSTRERLLRPSKHLLGWMLPLWKAVEGFLHPGIQETLKGEMKSRFIDILNVVPYQWCVLNLHADFLSMKGDQNQK